MKRIAFLGFDIGGTDIKYGCVNSVGECFDREKIKTPETHSELVQVLTETIANVDKKTSLSGIGLSIPGVISKNRMISSGALDFIERETFLDDLKKAVDLPITMMNDANAVCMAERWVGKGQDLANFICITLGTAVGGGIVINHELYEGYNGLAGEFGMSYALSGELHVVNTVAAQCGVVAGGCRRYSQLTQSKTRNFEEIMLRRKQNDALAELVVSELAYKNALLAHNLAVTFGPECILLSGSISHNQDFVQMVRNFYLQICREKNALPLEVMPTLEASMHSHNSGIIGSVYMLAKGEMLYD